MKRICAVVICATLALLSAKAQIFCWNIENFFDSRDDPATADENFTPGGEMHWTRRRFEAKRNLIAKTIIASAERLGGQIPCLIGLCEVENRAVLSSLLEDTPLAKCRYRALHRDSGDPRGIDVALLYDPARICLLEAEFITIGVFATREILYAKVMISHREHFREPGSRRLRANPSRLHQGQVGDTSGAESPHKLHSPPPQANETPAAATSENRFADTPPAGTPPAGTLPADTLHVFVNHWPSKYSGAKASKPRREAVARALAARIDSVYALHPDAALLVMGDFNDTAESASVASLCSRCRLENLTEEVEGTIKFKGKWETIDLMLANPAAAAIISPAEAFKPDFLLEEDKTFLGRKPRRSYIGPRYNCGASDHLPIIAKFLR